MSDWVALLDGGKREAPVRVREAAPGVYEVTLRGEAHVVDAHAPDRDTLSLVVGTASRTATLDRRAAGVRVRVGRSTFALELLDARRVRARRTPRPLAPEGRAELVAPLPGRVARVLVGVGDAVRAGQPLVVLEALEMENALPSPRDGKVVEVHVTEGQRVEGHARLCAVE